MLRPTLVVAIARNGVIGRNGGLPWRLPNDLRHFRRLTLGHTVLMGRRTWESLGRPLDGRDNWVLTRDPGFTAQGARVFAGFETLPEPRDGGPLLVIGGATLYAALLPKAGRIELTEVHADVEGDTHFPAFDRADWLELAREDHPVDERHAYPYSFVTLARRAGT